MENDTLECRPICARRNAARLSTGRRIDRPGDRASARSHCRNRCGAALLMSLFVIMFVSVMLMNILDTELLQYSAYRNTTDYERALYLAGAAVHHATAELENDFTWRGTVTDGSYPADDTYQATAADGVGNLVVITGVGIAGDVTRRLQVTVAWDN